MTQSEGTIYAYSIYYKDEVAFIDIVFDEIGKDKCLTLSFSVKHLSFRIEEIFADCIYRDEDSILIK